MNVLVVAPHMDDEVLGMGATIARHVREGDELHVCCVAHRVYGHKLDKGRNEAEIACAHQAQAILGYKELQLMDLPDERLDACLQDIIIPLERCVQQFRPEVVYVCHRGDNNQDHRAVFYASMVALRPSANPRLRTVLCYETPSSTEQAPPIPEAAFLPNYYVNVTDFLEIKLTAIKTYSNESRPYPHPRSQEAVRLLAQRRGVESGFDAAEAFAILRDRRL